VYRFFLSLLIIDAVILIMVVLLQAGKGGGLSAEFGGASSSTDAFMGGRQAATLLTRTSWVSGGVFLGLALMLTILSARTRAPASILEGQFAPPTNQEVPTPLLQREAEEVPEEGAIPGITGADEGEGEETPPPDRDN
jgi:preprotein translocase subunit SecG